MNGILDLGKYQELLDKNNSYLAVVKKDSQNFISIIEQLENCCSGKTMDFMFSPLRSHVLDLMRISTVFENYLDALNSVKKNYELQSISLAQQVNHVSRKL